MNISMFKIFMIFGVVSSWAAEALTDGKITLDEAVDLAKNVAKILDVKIEIGIPVNAPKIDDKDYVPIDVDVHLTDRGDEAAGKPLED